MDSIAITTASGDYLLSISESPVQVIDDNTVVGQSEETD
jgi:hypothetical protein